MTKLQEIYRRERKRIQNYISNRKSKGFLSDFELPKIPKKITQGSINRLRKITPEKLRESEHTWFSELTGEIVKGKHSELTSAYRKERRQIRQEKQSLKKQKEAQPKSPEISDVSRETFPFDKVAKARVNDVIVQLDYQIAHLVKSIFIEILNNGYTWFDIYDALEEMSSRGKSFEIEEFYSEQSSMKFMNEILDAFDLGRQYASDLEELMYSESVYEWEAMYD